MKARIKLEPHNNREGLQHDTCYVCGRPLNPGAINLLIDRNSGEVLDATNPANLERGAIWPVGTTCQRNYPGIQRFAVVPPSPAVEVLESQINGVEKAVTSEGDLSAALGMEGKVG